MLRGITAAAGLLLGAAPLTAGEKAAPITFAKGDAGKLPAGWTAALTGKGETPVWKVVADDTAPSKSGAALAQTSKSPKAAFNVCVADKTKYQDVEVSVAVKAVAGEGDQGGGAVWRYQDANNYYIARFNPLEENYRLYKIVKGQRLQLASKENVTASTGKWHTIKIVHIGDQIACYLDGKKVLETKDATFAGAGQVGLWTKADAQTYFDNFTVQALPRKGR